MDLWRHISSHWSCVVHPTTIIPVTLINKVIPPAPKSKNTTRDFFGVKNGVSFNMFSGERKAEEFRVANHARSWTYRQNI